MSAWTPKCGRCSSPQMVEEPGVVETSDGDVRTTHRCLACGARSHVTPPEDVWLRELIAEVNAA